MTFDWLPFDRLSARQVYDVLALRQRVFIVEQTCPYPDADGVDFRCWHALGCDEAGQLVATARLVPPGVKYVLPAIGRVVVAPEARRAGAGRALMESAIAQVQRLYPGQGIALSAQRYLERFYASLGFVVAGAPYEEDGIPHVEMVRGEAVS
jgi:ElaA protein